MKIGAVITSRMGSSRLYGKSMAMLVGKPTLWHIITRLQKSKRLNEIIVATTTKKEDDVIYNLAIEMKVKAFRGSSEDVLGRVVKAAKSAELDIIVLITGDCPMVDPLLVDMVIERYLREKPDYASDRLEHDIPPGLDIEVFATSLLEAIAKNVKDKFVREHVTLYFYEHPEKYSLLNVKLPEKLRRNDLRLTIDTKEDLLFAQKVFEELYRAKRQFFHAEEVIDLLQRKPELAKINVGVRQKRARE